jgi:hypothetical protein
VKSRRPAADSSREVIAVDRSQDVFHGQAP